VVNTETEGKEMRKLLETVVNVRKEYDLGLIKESRDFEDIVSDLIMLDIELEVENEVEGEEGDGYGNEQ
jgi:hypothetical protein